MTANELRINNYLRSTLTGEIFRVTAEDIVNIQKDSSVAEPIPLTEDWLLKLGFNFFNSEYGGMYKIDALGSTLYLRPFRDGSHLWGLMDDNEDHIQVELLFVQPIYHVHAIQNLYFALTGEELTINPARQ